MTTETIANAALAFSASFGHKGCRKNMAAAYGSQPGEFG